MTAASAVQNGWLPPLPDPVGWALEQVTGAAGDAASAVAGWTFDKVVAGISGWVRDAVSWVAGAIFGFFERSTSPDVTARWFVDGSSSVGGPYRMMAALAAITLVGAVLAAVVHGVLTGDTAGMVRRVLVEAPIAVLGIGGAVVVAQLAIDVTDAWSGWLLAGFGDEVDNFGQAVGMIDLLTGAPASSLVVVLLGLFALIGGLVVFIELVIRSALVYLLVALTPLAFAARVWPGLRGVLRKTIDLLAAVIFSKVVVALALAIGAAALGGALTGGTGPADGLALPMPGTPEAAEAAADPVATGTPAEPTEAVGTLLTAVAVFGVAAFSPFLLVRLFPLVEAAVVAQGVRGGPMRAAQQAWSVKYQTDIARRLGGSGDAGGGAAATAVPAVATGAARIAATAGGGSALGRSSSGAAQKSDDSPRRPGSPTGGDR